MGTGTGMGTEQQAIKGVVVLMNCSKFSVLVVSLCLLVYTIIAHTAALSWLSPLLYLLSPFLVIGMVYSVLKKGVYSGPELQPGEEFGYQDWDHRKK